jgi:hypothetical protein
MGRGWGDGLGDGAIGQAHTVSIDGSLAQDWKAKYDALRDRSVAFVAEKNQEKALLGEVPATLCSFCNRLAG